MDGITPTNLPTNTLHRVTLQRTGGGTGGDQWTIGGATRRANGVQQECHKHDVPPRSDHYGFRSDDDVSLRPQQKNESPNTIHSLNVRARKKSVHLVSNCKVT